MNRPTLRLGPWRPLFTGRKKIVVETAALALLAAALELFGLATLVPLLSGSSRLPGWQLAALFGVTLATASLVRYWADRRAIRVAIVVEKDLRIDMLDRLAAARWSAVASLDHGELSTRLSSTTSQIANGFSALIAAATGLITLVVLGLGAVYLDPLLSLVLVLFLVLSIPLYRAAVQRARRVHSGLLAVNIALSEEISTILQNAKQLFVSAGRDIWLEDLRSLTSRVAENTGRERTLAPRLRRDTELLGVLFICLAVLIAQARDNLPSTVAFLAVFYRMVPRLQGVQSQMSTVRGQEVWLADWSAFCERLQYVPASGGVVLHHEDGTRPDLVRFDSVSLRHSGAGGPVLQDLSLLITAGETLVITGPTGVGKTTLLDAIAGLIEPDRGTITYGAPDESAWRARVAYATQDPMLRSGSVRHNLAWLVPAEDDTRLQQVIDVCQLRAFVDSRPEGLDARLNLKATTISGGQRQRLALARTLMTPADLLILDEATSAMDQATERRLLEALFASGLVQSVVAVTHRLETTRLFSRTLDVSEFRPVGGRS